MGTGIAPSTISGLKDGGTRQTYGTGAQKEDSSKTLGKGAYHLLPRNPIHRVSEIYRKGAIKYDARNWEKGIPLSRMLDSAMRHLFQFADGQADEDHLHQCIWNLFGISETIERINRGILPASLQDLPSNPIPGQKFRQPGFAIRHGLDTKEKEHLKGSWEPQREVEETDWYTPFVVEGENG